jgi:HK97 family phage portal protein
MPESNENRPFGGAQIVYSAVAIKKESKQIDEQDQNALDVISHPEDTTDYSDLLLAYNDSVEKNAFHSRCLRVKTDCTVGLGINIMAGKHKDDPEKAHAKLSSVNDKGQSFQEAVNRVALDFFTTGNGYLEVVRNNKGQVGEFYFMPATKSWVAPRDREYNFVYQNSSMLERAEFKRFTPGDTKAGSTIIHFANYTQANIHYGLPDWRGCLDDIALDYYAVQYNKKFFINSGVPDLAIVVKGGAFDEDTRNAVVAFFQENIKGYLNAHRTLYLPISDKEIEVKFERLAMDQMKDSSFDKLRERVRDNVVSAHGVPPRLVGIVVGGQLGGGGEITGQLATFQEITVNPVQMLFETKLNPALQSFFDDETFKFSFEKMNTDVQEGDSVYYPALVNSGIITVDEARDQLGWEPMPEKKPEDVTPPEKIIMDGLESIKKALEAGL